MISLEAHVKSIQAVIGTSERGSYKACPNEAVTSLKSLSKSLTGRKEIWPGTQRSFPLQGTEVTVVTERSLSRELRCVRNALGSVNTTSP